MARVSHVRVTTDGKLTARTSWQGPGWINSVAILLAKLCTRRGSLAQGAITSTYLANLALYREEPELYRKLSAIGASYTRFVDDMHASVRRRLEPATLTRVVGKPL